MEDSTPSKWQKTESRCQDKIGKETQRGAVYNDKMDIPPREHNTLIYMHLTQGHQST